MKFFLIRQIIQHWTQPLVISEQKSVNTVKIINVVTSFCSKAV